MESIVTILKKIEGYLAEADIKNARLNAELLMGKALGMKRLDLYLNFEKPVEESTLKPLREWVKRRRNREPLQYILGETAFMDLSLKVDSRALIPRPETEELVEFLGERIKESPNRILDLGTGTGALALTFAQKYPDAEVLAVDKSSEALELARENAELNHLGNRVTFVESDWWTGVDGSFDLVVSNPPYLTEKEWEAAEPEVRVFEPKGALVASDEGRKDIELIIEKGFERLKPGGLLALETGIAHHDWLKEITKNWSSFESLKDLSGRDRFVILTR